MIIQEDESSASYQIQRYESGQIWINGICYQQSVIIRPNELILWQPQKIDELNASHFEPLLMNKADIVILGTGPKLIVPDQSVLRALYQNGMGVEFMDSKAACRTYTVLASEMRSVAACILII